MPNSSIDKLSREAGIPKDELEKLWKEAKSAVSDPEDFAIIMTIFKKKVAKEYGKSALTKAGWKMESKVDTIIGEKLIQVKDLSPKQKVAYMKAKKIGATGDVTYSKGNDHIVVMSAVIQKKKVYFTIFPDGSFKRGSKPEKIPKGYVQNKSDKTSKKTLKDARAYFDRVYGDGDPYDMTAVWMEANGFSDKEIESFLVKLRKEIGESKVDQILASEKMLDKWYTKGVHNSRISRVKGLGTARGIRDNHAACASCIIKGDDGKLWVMPKSDGDKMVQDYNMELIE